MSDQPVGRRVRTESSREVPAKEGHIAVVVELIEVLRADTAAS